MQKETSMVSTPFPFRSVAYLDGEELFGMSSAAPRGINYNGWPDPRTGPLPSGGGPSDSYPPIVLRFPRSKADFCCPFTVVGVANFMCRAFNVFPSAYASRITFDKDEGASKGIR